MQILDRKFIEIAVIKKNVLDIRRLLLLVSIPVLSFASIR